MASLRINDLIQNIVGSPREFDNDARILHGVCFTMAVIGLLATLISIWPIGSGLAMIIPCFVGAILGGISWYLGRYHGQFMIAFVMLLLCQITALTIVFLNNDGIYGPSVFFFATWVPVYIFILDRALAVTAAALFFCVFSALYFLQVKGLIHPVDFSGQPERAFDNYSAFVFHFAITIIIAVWAKLAFQDSRKKIQDSSEAKTKFLANISHEIRTPMNAILGMTELTLLDTTDEQQRARLEASRTAAHHLLNLVEDMLDISSIDEGRLVTHKQPFALRETVIGIANVMRESAAEKGLTLEMDFDPQLPAWVETDPVRLRQVLVNLLNNAIKFSDRGTISLFVGVKETTPAVVTLLFSLRDNGIGIAREQQEQVFEIFTRGSNINAFRHKGFGLGLSISRHLVEKLGGTIWVRSEPGVGSTFYFTLPVTRAAAADDAAENPVSLETPALKLNHLLLVEDNDINAEVASHILQKKGYTLDLACNGNQALAKLAKHKYTVILMDLEMPVMDGFETTKALRSGLAGSLNQRTPILAITAHALNEYRERSIASGMQGFITKPINADVLAQEVARLAVRPASDFQI